ncbi:hypothetical protein FACS1894166_00500 [Bacilli bacterium]|nr:hypothetical protein FACS1894166_00500 [Bacilli bacterium]
MLLKVRSAATFDLKYNLVSFQYIGAGLVVVATITFGTMVVVRRPLTYVERVTILVTEPVYTLSYSLVFRVLKTIKGLVFKLPDKQYKELELTSSCNHNVQFK